MKDVSDVSETIEISLKEQETKGYVIATNDGHQIGLMTYSKPSESLIIIDHTDVDPAFQGRNVGKKLLTTLVADTQNKGRKIIPLCPFANAMFSKYEHFQNVQKK